MNNYEDDSGSDWEYECVLHLGEGCVCWGCEQLHDDCFANIYDEHDEQ